MTRAVVLWAALVAGAPGAAPWALAAQGTQPLRIGFVRAEEILRQTPGYARAESTFNNELRASQQEVQRLQAKLDSAIRAFEQQSIALTPTVRQTRQRELGELQQQFQQRAAELQEKARQRERELLEPIQERVNLIIQGLRAEGNYAFIFDADATPGIVAADPSLNLTAKVVERLRQK
jgi:Skp family chaperone for outer membrane proteins